jgi:hypothetical protein
MGEDFVGAGEYLFITKETFEGSQHWFGESYPSTLGTNWKI